jgi:putative endonuclease
MFKGWGWVAGWVGGRLGGRVGDLAGDTAGGPAGDTPQDARPRRRGNTGLGDGAEDQALIFLQQQGLRLECRNYRLAGGPHQRGAEIDLILRAQDGTLVFVEVKARRDTRHGGAAASVSVAQQQRIAHAARHYLMGRVELPPCRFDVVAIDGADLQWFQAAFEA